MPIAASPKYMAEHMGLPYHQSAIREQEYPPDGRRSQREQLSEGSRKFLRYSYGDLLPKDKDWKVIFRIWAGHPARAALGRSRLGRRLWAQLDVLRAPTAWSGASR